MCFVEELGPFPKESTLYLREFEPFCKKNSLLFQKVIFSLWNFSYSMGNLLKNGI
jgi:hypothetical protein